MSPHSVSSVRPFKFMPYVAHGGGRGGAEALAADPEVISIEQEITVKPSLAGSHALIGAPQAGARAIPARARPSPSSIPESTGIITSWRGR